MGVNVPVVPARMSQLCTEDLPRTAVGALPEIALVMSGLTRPARPAFTRLKPTSINPSFPEIPHDD